MRTWCWLVILAVALPVAFVVGQNSGERRCPELARVQAEADRNFERQFAKMMAEPQGRELVCEKIFDLVRDELEQEIYLEEDERDAAY